MNMLEQSVVHRRQDYLPPAFLIDTVTLECQLDRACTLVTCAMTMRRNPDSLPQSDLVLDGDATLKLLSLKMNGDELPTSAWQRDTQSLTIFNVPDQFVLGQTTQLAPEHNSALEGLYAAGDMLLTQCEAEGFRRIVFFLDRPDVLAKYQVRLQAEKSLFPVMLSNGNLIAQGDLPNGAHFAQWDDPWPKPSYLFAIAAGNMASVSRPFVTATGRLVQLHIWTDAVNLKRCEFALESLEKAMQWDEQRFGRHYDLDVYNIVATFDFNMGAMENKGLNIFNAKYILADQETATDADFAGVEGVIGHEYFHNWSGNRVTCRDWFQLSLKEGLTVFRDQEFSADVGSAASKRLQDVARLKAQQFAEDAGPLCHPVRPESYSEINNFYTATVYEKGAEVIRMLQTILGKETFRQGLDHYFAVNDGRAATVEDLLAAMSHVSCQDLDQFAKWYGQSGTPFVMFAGHHDSEQKRYILDVEQSHPSTPGQAQKEPLVMPLRVALLDARNGSLIGDSVRVLLLTQTRQRFEFEQVENPATPSLMREFSAPVKWRFDYSLEERCLLLAHDDDALAKAENAQALHLQVILRRLDEHLAGRESPLPGQYVDALRHALTDQRIDHFLRVAVLQIPSADAVADELVEIDVQAIHAVRSQLRREVGMHLQADWQWAAQANRTNEAYAPTPQQAGQRALRHLALDFLAAAGSLSAESVLQDFRNADNMTDRLAHLQRLVHFNMASANAAINEFYVRYENDELVLDKWFAVQASAPLPSTFDRVRELVDHNKFSLRNPNKVRSLLGTFARSNPSCFHHGDGATYEWFAQQVQELDALNPQVAAKLSSALAGWRRYHPGRRAQMLQALLLIGARPGCSRDVAEVVRLATQNTF
jgi:aminopeptidase N